MKKTNRKMVIGKIGLVVFSLYSCTNNTEQTLNDAIAMNETSATQTNEQSVPLNPNQYLTEQDIQNELSIVSNVPNYSTLKDLGIEQWAGYASGFYQSVDFPCLLFNPSENSFLISSPRTQKKVPLENIEDAMDNYKNELIKSGFFDKGDAEQSDQKHSNNKFDVSKDQLRALEHISTSSAFVYISGIGLNDFDYPLMYACNKSYGPVLRLMGKDGLNATFEISLIDSAFNQYETYIHSRFGVMNDLSERQP